MPQQQLHSISLRYRHALVCPGSMVLPRRHALVELGQSVRETMPAASEYHRHEKLARLEAVLFVANEPLSTRKIAQLGGLADGTEARTLIRRLNDFYDLQASAFRVEQVAGGYQLLTRAKFGGWLRRLRQMPAESRLSAPATETLAVVAYRQPAVRSEIESIRGVQCGEILRQLMDRDLIRIVGRSDDLGRPFLYGTTKRFLQWAGLRSLEELPRATSLRHKPMDGDPSSHETLPAARRENEPNPRNDFNEESEVKIAAIKESALTAPCNTEMPRLDPTSPEPTSPEPWMLAVEPRAHADKDEDLDDDEFDDDDDDLDEDDDEYDDDDDDLDDEDLEDEEWEEVDDEDDDWDDEDEDWDEDDEDEDEDEDWDEE